MNLQNKDQIRSIYACIRIVNDLEHLLFIAKTTGMSVREWEGRRKLSAQQKMTLNIRNWR